MTEAEKLNLLKEMYGDNESDKLLLAYLKTAEEIILNRLYPYKHDEKCIPTKYDYKQVAIANYLLNKRGAEGEITHKENGIDRTYGSADVPEEMLNDIVPYCGVF